MESGPRRVLAVDDDPVSLAVTAVLLEAEGCAVLQALSGEAALEMAVAYAPDCVLADLRMPGLSSTALARSLRQVVPSARLFAMSATPPPHLEGYDGILKKPLSPESLQAALTHSTFVANTDTVPPRSADGDSAIDFDVFDRLRRAIQVAGVKEIYDVFLHDTRQRLSAMRSADPAAIRREAHTIKGGAGMVGALLVARAAAAVEAGIDDPGDRLRKLDEIEAHCRSTEIILKQRLNP
jgi:CheY-like chemotaxis protein/HPt (histidine-containing phosphotransfer) domain-containing protein